MYKVIHGLSPELMDDVFRLNQANREAVAFNTRGQSDFYNSNNHKSLKYGLETLRHFGPRIWELVPNSLKETDTFSNFKKGIKQWLPIQCPCRLCQSYIQGLGYCNITSV